MSTDFIFNQKSFIFRILKKVYFFGSTTGQRPSYPRKRDYAYLGKFGKTADTFSLYNNTA